MDNNYTITYRKKDKGWQYIINVKENGKWKYVGSKQGFGTRGAAKVVADQHMEELRAKAVVLSEAAPEHRGITVKELVDMYKKHKTIHRSANTVSLFDRAMKYFAELNNMIPSDVQIYHIQKCIDVMVENGLKLSTVKLYVGAVSTFFGFVINSTKVIAENPVKTKDLIFPTRDKTAKGKIKALSKSELDDLLSKIKKPRYYIASLLAAKCGLRIGEIVGLTWDRIDEEKLTLTVDRQWKRLIVDGVETYGFGTTKSVKSERMIDVSPVTMAELSKYKRTYPRHISGRVLPYRNTTTAAHILSRLYRKLGYDISVHDLRHTYATTLLANGLDPKTVAEYMGHDIEETIRTYSHVTSDMRKKARDIITAIL
jgi:integrase